MLSTLFRKVLPMVAALALTAASLAYLALHRTPEPVEDAPAEEEHAKPYEEPVDVRPPSERIDAALLGGRYATALRLCRDEPNPSADELPEWADREALALEGLGELDEAMTAYHRVADSHLGPEARTHAELGLVRCEAKRGHVAAARERLNRLVLQSAGPACGRMRPLAECLFLRAWLDVLALGPTAAPGPLLTDAVEWPTLLPTVERLFEWELTPRKSAPPEAGIAVQPVKARPDDPTVTAHLGETSTLEVLQRILAAAGLTVRLDTPTERLVTRSVAIAVHDCPLSELLTALLDLDGYSWRRDGSLVVVFRVTNSSTAHQRFVADRSLRGAALVSPSYPTAAAALTTAANIAWIAGRPREACDGYKQVLTDTPHAPASAAAAYNLGLAELRLGHHGAARTAFLDRIDRTALTGPDHLCWWWVGLCHLDAGEPHEAVAPLRTAQESQDRELESAATLGLCASHLFQGDEAAVVKLLRERRFDSRPHHAVLHEALEALLRYRVRPSETRAAELAAALKRADDGRSFGTTGVYLAGKAYAEIGRPDAMAAVFETEFGKARGLLGAEMAFATAERHREQGRTDSARQRYLAAKRLDPREYGPRAELRLAELAFRESRWTECVARCRAIVRNEAVDPMECLTLMGRAYEAQRLFQHAAECFAGRLPTE